MDISRFKNGAKTSRIDFIIDNRRSLELVECKIGNHPSYNLLQAIGAIVIYRSLMKMGCKIINNGIEIPIRKKVTVSICMIEGYKYEKYSEEWTDAHKKLLRMIEKNLGEKIKVYLIKPINDNCATKKYWDKPEFQKIVPLS